MKKIKIINSITLFVSIVLIVSGFAILNSNVPVPIDAYTLGLLLTGFLFLFFGFLGLIMQLYFMNKRNL